MSAITSVVSDLIPAVSGVVPIFNAATGYMSRQASLEMAAQRQQLAAERAAANAAARAAAQQQAEENLRSTQALQMRQLQETQAADTATQDASIQNQMDQAQLSANTDEQTRRDALRQAVAKSTVNLAGQGIDPHDGSGEAILLGQIRASDQDHQAAAAATQLRLQALSQQASALNQRNLLEQTQLAERQRLQWLNSFS